ncbi:MAG: UDP-N-acetylmuramoyl-tripeptide--D-alanyl-D-alanine ligase [Thermoleophilia bacterium]|nr:UDP-N-acetylmuramoyl-tripeptide--D-alanyl-D-alanine ligase [Thermoleophilia bacterium]
MSEGADRSDATTMGWSLLEIVEALGCAVYGPIGDDAELHALRAAHVTIDTRTVRPGSLFVALQGTRTHGLEFARAAFEQGAVAVLAGTDLDLDDATWEQLVSDAAAVGPVLVASDCDGITALGRLARAWRRRSPWQVVGITGSSGKTTTKDIARVLLERSGRVVVASHANWNNEIGVPLTLLAARDSTDVVICEMGMRGAGQIDYLCGIADPDIGVVTTAGTAHLELLGSEEAIVSAKAEILAGTWRGGVGVFPGMQAHLVEAAVQTPDRLLPFGMGDDEADSCAVLVTHVQRSDVGISGRIDLMGAVLPFSVPIHGVHQARNVAAAASVLVTLTGSASLLPDDALLIGAESVDDFTRGRGDRHQLPSGGLIIDDAYNANPESVAATLAELAATESRGRRVAVLGRMAELGPLGTELHRGIGRTAAEFDAIDELVVVGAGVDVDAIADGWSNVRGEAPIRFGAARDALAARDAWIDRDDVVLVKASNSSGLGELASSLVEVLRAPRASAAVAPKGGES